ncbi:FAD-dependent oxidoreductase [Candidatus Pseudothioglobus singularis]|nr:FAD-dependent oxidoreductase [Candidatus Pseudothioglobus singularis]
MSLKNKYDWIIVGGGISGISLAEILCRGGKSVLLIEKNEKLASETSKVFHEWMHSGSLYSLAPDRLLTLRYLLGATDDLFEYYYSFPSMNLRPTEAGTKVKDNGWFNNQHIEYRYKMHRLNPVWSSLVSRSINIIDLLNEHDWMRKRAGSEYGNSKVRYSHWFDNIIEQIKCDSKFYYKVSPDITMNSRKLIGDILSAAFVKGLTIKNDSAVINIIENNESTTVQTDNGIFQSSNVVICSPDFISKFLNIPIKIGYAPIAVVENVPEEEVSFVELDYNTKKCINLLKKTGGIGQAGGITLGRKKDVDVYLKYIISQHKKRNPGINVLDTYIGLKKELVQKGENRNYLYHINQNSKRVWSVVLGKFSLAFSMAPEFYRRVYNENPPKMIDLPLTNEGLDSVSETSWKEIVINSRS